MAGFCRVCLSVCARGSGKRSFNLLGEALAALFDEIELDTLALGEGDEGLLAITNGENVVHAGSKDGSVGVFDVGDLIRTGVVLDVHELTDTTNVVSAVGEHSGAVFELNDGIDFSSLEVELQTY